MEDHRNLAVVSKPSHEDGTQVLRVTSDLFEGDGERKRRFNMVRYFNPDRSEVFFARRVILVEGATEKSTFPVIAERLNVFDHRITILDCGGKFNLTLFMKVLNAFHIPYITIYDEDPIPEELKPGNTEYVEDKYNQAKRAFEENTLIEGECDTLIGTTHMISETFEDFIEESKTSIVKKGKPLASVEYFSDDMHPIPQELEILVKQVYAK